MPFDNFGNIHISNLDPTVFKHEDISTLNNESYTFKSLCIILEE